MTPKLLCAFFVSTSLAFAAETKLQDRLAGAKPGQTITLPAGEFVGGVTIPPGVSLKGAGIGKTIVTGGMTSEGGSISDLTVRNAPGAGITVRKAESAILARVRVTGCASGIAFQDVKKGRIENCISDHNSVGIAINSGADCAVVNCTVSACPEMGLSFAASPNLTAFNNCVVGSAICLNIDRPEDVHVDHNLYFGTFVGQMQEQSAKRILAAWHYLTGLDAHSVQMPVTFAEDFTPTRVLPWALDRATTAEWGATELAGVKAPATDLLGNHRAARPGVGAIEAAIKTPRAADGSFTIASDVGTKSAGAFTKDGILVAYLFQDLPLPKGKYSFWLPTRDYSSQPIPAGDYEVRVAENDFQWQYLSHIGDNGGDRPMPESASFNPFFVTFAPNGTLIMQEGPSEDHSPVRGYDAATGKLLWHLPSGFLHALGIAVDKANVLYVLLGFQSPKGEARLDRLDSATGKIIPWPGSKNAHLLPVTSPQACGMTILSDRLFVADAAGNKLFVIRTSDGQVEKSLDVPAPHVISADEKTQVIWVASGNSVLAVKADGTKVAESSIVPDPVAVAARDGQLAVASGKTGKIHVFDANDPKNLKPVRELGRGDGPYGAIVPDRFWFQKSPGWQPRKDSPATRHQQDIGDGKLALGPNGELAVTDSRRILVFDKTGKNLWYTIGCFGGAARPSYSTQNRRFYDSGGDVSFWLNEKDGTWQPEALWDRSAALPEGEKARTCQFLGDFGLGGKTFAVIASATCGLPYGPPAGQCDVPVLTVARLDGFKFVPVLQVTGTVGNYVVREDTSGDGRITADDTAQPLVDANGKSPQVQMISRFVYLEPDGGITAMQRPPWIWRPSGLNARGVPNYEGKNFVQLPMEDWQKEISPYTFKPEWGEGPVVLGLLKDSGYVAQMNMVGSGGSGMNNGAGTDLVGFGPDGRRRWVRQLAEHKGICGMGTADDITLTAVFYSCETITADADGLSLGGFCEPPKLYFAGYWLDHPNLRLFKMPDNHVYATWGDDSSGRHPWFRLNNQESLKKSRHPFRVTDERAKELAALEWKPAPPTSGTLATSFRIPHLAQPLTIDGDLEKWRKAGVTPQIVIGPNGGFKGPGDNSALIRMAYEGQNLYYQILQFDDVPVFYGMVDGQCVETAINGASEGGFQFCIFKSEEGEDIVWRNRFFSKLPQTKLDPKHAPRIIKVLPDAKAVTERVMLEALYGVDLSNAKVIVTEFKLPLDNETYKGSEQDVPVLGPGKTFWTGFFVDDNDVPYADVQRLIAWPVTFGVFNPPNDGAQAVCE